MKNRVLVIDDSPVVVAHLRRILEGDGHAVEALYNFVDLHTVMRRFDPELVFLDIEMPGLNGLKMGEFVRRFETRRTQIIVYSSRPLAELEAIAEKVDADAVIQKGSSAERIRSVAAGLASGSVQENDRGNAS